MKTNVKKNKTSLVFVLWKYGSLWQAGVSDKYIYAQEQQAAIDLLYGRQFPFISTTRNGAQPMSRFKKRDQRGIVKWPRLKAPFNKT